MRGSSAVMLLGPAPEAPSRGQGPGALVSHSKSGQPHGASKGSSTWAAAIQPCPHWRLHWRSHDFALPSPAPLYRKAPGAPKLPHCFAPGRSGHQSHPACSRRARVPVGPGGMRAAGGCRSVPAVGPHPALSVRRAPLKHQQPAASTAILRLRNDLNSNCWLWVVLCTEAVPLLPAVPDSPHGPDGGAQSLCPPPAGSRQHPQGRSPATQGQGELTFCAFQWPGPGLLISVLLF